LENGFHPRDCASLRHADLVSSSSTVDRSTQIALEQGPYWRTPGATVYPLAARSADPPPPAQRHPEHTRRHHTDRPHIPFALRHLVLETKNMSGWIADSTPFGHSAHEHPDTRSTLIRTGSRSAATQVCIVSLKSLSSSISLRACASIRPSVRSDKRFAPAGRGSHRPRSDRRSTHAICPPASGW
jgi:hypothetical protein